MTWRTGQVLHCHVSSIYLPWPLPLATPQIKDLGEQVKEHEKTLAQLQEREKALTAQFMERVGEGNKFKDFLLKASSLTDVWQEC